MAEKDWLSRALEVANTLIAIAILYCAAAPLFEWWPAEHSSSAAADHPATGVAVPSGISWPLAIIGVVLVAATISHTITSVWSRNRVKFFPNRQMLQAFSGGGLGQRLEKSKDVSAIMANGLDYYSRQVNIDRVKRLLLPNPSGESSKYYAEKSSHHGQPDAIRETTRRAQEAGARVRWYDHFIFQSVVLSDTDKKTGWMQVESMLPHANSSRRPSYTVYKRASEEAVLEMRRVFDAIWDSAEEQ